MPNLAPKMDHVIGIDLGATKILAGIFTNNLDCLHRNKLTTKSDRGVDAVIERIVRCVRELVSEAELDLEQVAGIGIGAPGTINPNAGKVAFAPNLQWEDVALKKALEKALQRPVWIENDCNLATLGIYEKELKRQPSVLMGIFLGTGIGAGTIINGQLYSGFNNTSGEIGHCIMDSRDPDRTFESLAGRHAIFMRIRREVKAGQRTILTHLLGPDLNNLRSRALRKAIKRGDDYVEKIIKEAAYYTGLALSNVINFLNPEVIVLGGGMIEALEKTMMPVIRKTAIDNAFHNTSDGIQILATKLGDDAGITGAAVWAHTKLNESSP